eukprot:SAG31_NODE_9041_length_1344_cov_0.956627_3_plen_217_part_01
MVAGLTVDDRLRVIRAARRPLHVPSFRVFHVECRAKGKSAPADAAPNAEFIIGQWGPLLFPVSSSSKSAEPSFAASFMSILSWEISGDNVVIRVQKDQLVTLQTTQASQICDALMAGAMALKELITKHGKSGIKRLPQLAPYPAAAGIREGMKIVSINGQSIDTKEQFDALDKQSLEDCANGCAAEFVLASGPIVVGNIQASSIAAANPAVQYGQRL